MSDYDGIEDSVVGLFKILAPLAVVGALTLIVGLAWLIIFCCYHLKWVQ